jgi:Glycosyl hydrolase family 63 C-terminal domain
VVAERERLEKRREKSEHWGRWGPYVSERQWGTVREDYSPGGEPWAYFPHDHARSRAYRWGEDGIGGISDDRQLLCFALALYNGKDPIVKERLFGLTNPQGNHGEDVKEYYFYLDNLPSHAYMKMLYRYPQDAFPYDWLIAENGRRSRAEPEFELIDTGIFAGDRFFDVFVEYAKASPEDILARFTAVNRGPETATIHLLPTLWFRNTWSWRKGSYKPSLQSQWTHRLGLNVVAVEHAALGRWQLSCEGARELLFTENETNYERLFGSPNAGPFVKDGINDYVVSNDRASVNALGYGTKAAAHYVRELAPGESYTVRLRLSSLEALSRDGITDPFAAFDNVFDKRRIEADEFYASVLDVPIGDDERAIARQAFAGMLWSKQFYYYVVQEWLDGDPAMPPPPPQRRFGRNAGWEFLHADDVLSMPDTWEYPWFAAWDLAFHCILFALIDPEYAKKQLMLLTREWYLHPNGQLPAYEWDFSDVNPPIVAWAAMRVYQIEAKWYGRQDRLFLERVFQKLLLTFTWWVNRKDARGNNIFQGGFLGLDNIGVFDRDMTLPAGITLDQSDGTSWMAVFSSSMLAIALELARELPAYEDIASKFFAHFLFIAQAMNELGAEGLWDEADGFYYDSLHDGNRSIPLRVRSAVGLIPLIACAVSENTTFESLHDFRKRVRWFVENRPDLTESIAYMEREGIGQRYLLALVDTDKLLRILRRMLDPDEFLSPYGVRSLSRVHLEHPFELDLGGAHYAIGYEPAESQSGTFGGNSNWRGPIWFPLNFLFIEALQKLHYYYGDDFKVEMPSGSGSYSTLWDVASDLSQRLIGIFTRDGSGRRAVFGGNDTFVQNPLWRDLIPFYEYFHGDNGAGLGASHQTGWTALVAKLILQQCTYREKHPLDTRPSG